MLGICQGVWENIFDIFFRPLKAISIKAFVLKLYFDQLAKTFASKIFAQHKQSSLIKSINVIPVKLADRRRT